RRSSGLILISGSHAMRLARPRNRAELPARVDAELDEYLPQMPLDGMRADEQLRADLLIRQTVTGEPRDLCLLGGQLITRTDRLLAHLFSGGDQLSAGPLAERLRSHRRVHVVGTIELLAGVQTTVRPA